MAKGVNAELFRNRLSRAKALEVLAEGGRLPQSEYLRCGVRYFTDGAVLGGKNFVEEIFQAFRERFGARRRNGARPVRGVEAANIGERLFNLRHLQKDVFG